MKVTDFLASFIESLGVDTVFGVTGGAAVHIFDSLHSNETTLVFNHHEQASALAAVSFARIKGFGVCVVTTGPGGTNAITGVLAAWQDSIPCLFISGQSRCAHTSRGKSVRQIGVQEFDILSAVEGMTKYSAVVDNVEDLPKHLEQAYKASKEGRPGPVWLDLPLDIQIADIDFTVVNSLVSEEIYSEINPGDITEVLQALQQSKRPSILLGYGVHLSHAEAIVKELIESYSLPFTATWTARDIIPSSHPLYIGNPGIAGQRGGNMVIQNSDLIIVLGSHLNMSVTGSNFSNFAREAKVVVVNIDENEIAELDKERVKVALGINADVKAFCRALINALKEKGSAYTSPSAWLTKCDQYKSLNKIPKERVDSTLYVDPYFFMEKLSNFLSSEPVVVDGGGVSLYASCQSIQLKKDQRLLLSSAMSSMGTGLPEAIGACFAVNRRNVICTIGDGSMQFNIQELQTILTYNLPIKIFVINNSGYLAMRHTQNSFLGGRHVGSSSQGMLEIPDYQKIAQAYGIKAVSISHHNEIDSTLKNILYTDTPIVCEVFVDPEGELIASQGFDEQSDGSFIARPLEDMAPYLPRKQFNSLMETES